MNFISIGGWCGTMIALKKIGLFNEPALPFDYTRSSLEGRIDCIENNFENYYPKEIKEDIRFYPSAYFLGEYIGFYHHNLLDKNVIESCERRIVRFDNKLKKNNCIFLRTIIRENYNDEIKHYKKLKNVIDKKYPNISYIICFIIPNQTNTQYYKHLDNNTFIFTLRVCYPHHHKGCPQEIDDDLTDAYKPIFNFITNENLFINIPKSNNIEINENLSTAIWLVGVGDYPCVNYIEK